MWQHVCNIWEKVRTSYWFVPVLLCAIAAGAAQAAVHVDREYAEHWRSIWLGRIIPRVQPASAQSILRMIGSTSITVAGVVFSITIAALTIASVQFGPRLLRQFMRDRATQVVLGVYVATTLYCLLVLRTLTSLEHGEFAPRLGVFGALLLAVAELFILIFFIHHISVCIQAESVVDRATEEAMATIARLYPAEPRGDAGHPPLPDGFSDRSIAINSDVCGYVRRVDLAQLAALACEHDRLITHVAAGRFVLNDELARVYPGDGLPQGLAEQIRAAFVLGNTRSPTQDIRYTIDRLVEVAARALSPGTNDPFTAVACIDRLGVVLGTLAGRPLVNGVVRDSAGTPRVFGAPPDFEKLLSYAFDAVRQYAGEHLIVIAAMLEVLARIAGAAKPERRAAVKRLAERTWDTCRAAQADDPSLPDLRRAFERVLAAAAGGNNPG
jgi:uncharacterized membrane protein